MALLETHAATYQELTSRSLYPAKKLCVSPNWIEAAELRPRKEPGSKRQVHPNSGHQNGSPRNTPIAGCSSQRRIAQNTIFNRNTMVATTHEKVRRQSAIRAKMHRQGALQVAQPHRRRVLVAKDPTIDTRRVRVLTTLSMTPVVRRHADPAGSDRKPTAPRYAAEPRWIIEIHEHTRPCVKPRCRGTLPRRLYPARLRRCQRSHNEHQYEAQRRAPNPTLPISHRSNSEFLAAKERPYAGADSYSGQPTPDCIVAAPPSPVARLPAQVSTNASANRSADQHHYHSPPARPAGNCGLSLGAHESIAAHHRPIMQYERRVWSDAHCSLQRLSLYRQAERCRAPFTRARIAGVRHRSDYADRQKHRYIPPKHHLSLPRLTTMRCGVTPPT